jgi:hypothetical protein
MAKREIIAGAIDQTIDVFILDSSSTIGAGLSGLVYNASGLTCYYRKGATGTATQLTLATQTVGGAHTDGGFVQIDATNMKGVYRLDLSDTIVATAGMVTIYLQGAANMAPCVLEVDVVADRDNRDARFHRAKNAIVLGTVTSGATTTSIPTSSLDPAASATDQFKGRILLFDRNTTTANLRGQATDITASTSGGVLTVTALSHAPVSGDTFTIE